MGYANLILKGKLTPKEVHQFSLQQTIITFIDNNKQNNKRL